MEVLKTINSENFIHFCTVFSHQQSYSKFSDDVIQYFTIESSIGSFFRGAKSKFDILHKLLKAKCSSSILQPSNDYSNFIKCLEQYEVFIPLKNQISKKFKEIRESMTRFSLGNSYYQMSPGTPPKQSKPLTERSCAFDYSVYLKDKYKMQPVTVYQEWHSEQNSNFIDVTISKYVYYGEPTNSFASSDDAIDYEIQYHAEECASYKEVFEFDNSGGNSHKQSILVEGIPGTGKTTFSHQICKEWALGHILEEYTHVVLIHLHEVQSHSIVSQMELFTFLGATNASATQTELATNRACKVLFWLEGWDELHDSYKKRSVFTDLLNGNAFPRATVVLSTRPSATGSLKKYGFLHKYKLVGFNKGQIETFVSDYFVRRSTGSSEEFMKQLTNTHSLAQLAMVPLHLSILLRLFSVYSKLPSSLTELYYRILLLALHYHKKRTFHDDTASQDLEDFPEKMLKELHGLEKFAYECLSTQRPISREQVSHYLFQSPNQQHFDGMGLLEIRKKEHVTGEVEYYHYQYKVIQEFLAALYIANLEQKEGTKELLSIFGSMHYEMVWVFYAGLTKFKKVTLQNILPKKDRQIQNSIQPPFTTHESMVKTWQSCYTYYKNMTDSKEFNVEFLLILMLCCYEAENPTACKVAADHFYLNDICRFEISPNRATPYLLLAVSYFIAHSGKMWSLRCDASIPSGVELLCKYIHKPENNGSLWVLCFVVTPSDIDKFIDLIRMQPSLQWIHLLNGSYLGDDGITKLCHFLTRDCSLIKIELEGCSIGSAGIKSIAVMLKENSKLVYVNLRKNCFQIQDMKYLLQTVQHNVSLEYLVVDEEYIQEEEIGSALTEINNQRKEYKVNALCLYHDFAHIYRQLYS